jgi:hypothetical protein
MKKIIYQNRVSFGVRGFAALGFCQEVFSVHSRAAQVVAAI